MDNSPVTPQRVPENSPLGQEVMVDDGNLRADARANRDRILDVARDALATDPAASLNSIAKAAGVGAGTLYRHFPSRESLVLAVYRKEIDTLAALAPALLAKHPSLQAFRIWCDRLAKFGRMKYGVADIVHAATSAQDIQETTYRPMLGAVRQLINACEGSGDIRRGNNPEDFLVLVGLLWRIPPNSAGEARVKRLLALAFRGLGVREIAVPETVRR
jgi:AcrR family transcriptional regulator